MDNREFSETSMQVSGFPKPKASYHLSPRG